MEKSRNSISPYPFPSCLPHTNQAIKSEVQVINGSNSPEQPLATPSMANYITTRLPEGQGSVVLYVRYLDSTATSPLGIPAGARLASPILNIQPIIAANAPNLGRRLLGADSPFFVLSVYAQFQIVEAVDPVKDKCMLCLAHSAWLPHLCRSYMSDKSVQAAL